jgi:uncharacterized damage-inducible protein DinB
VENALDPLRKFLSRVLNWEDAHVGFDKAVDGIPPEQRGLRPTGFDHSPWQLIEHLRLAQNDLLAFCLDAKYVHQLTWPDDYWPKEPEPATATAWDESIANFKTDRARLEQLVLDGQTDLFARVPAGEPQQTYLRSVMLVVDHNAYHLGQLIAVRRALGNWP